VTNRLAESTSPYLLQHKENPVDWYEWGEDAFEEARERDVPILLSVGYAACHWCHVMAHESFEDPQTAALMNERFVNIKVDREERPDVDSIYMEAVQAMTGHGGWPMTVWIDHEGRPFFAGTYFPKESRHGMASFRQVMDAVSSAWAEKREDVANQAQQLTQAISREVPRGDLPGESSLADAYGQIEQAFDSSHGGFGGAPKFPQQPVLEFLLRVRSEEWAPKAEEMLIKTLEEMAAGGIHDQLGGGFARYSVDAQWLVPHFEKMLYDNAQLARLYLWAGVEFERADFIETSRSTLDYLIRDLRHPDGGFYSSEDADSEGAEGKFYVWTSEEIRSVLGPDADAVMEYYGVTEVGNFEGANILHIVREDRPEGLDRAKQELFEARLKRVRPGLDDKVVTAWNGLAIRALAEAGAALDDGRYLKLAADSAVFALESVWVDDHLMRSWREGRTSVLGFLDDHASMAVGLFTLYEATGDERWYREAMTLVSRLDRFARPEGGYFSTSEAGEALVKRPTDLTDNPLPSGNALAAEANLLAALLTGDAGLRDRSMSALQSAALLMDRYPTMVAHHLSVLHASMNSRELAITGPNWDDLASVYWERFRPHIALAVTNEPVDEVPLLRDRFQDGKTLAYVCKEFVCDLPTSDAQSLRDQLS
jgi:uncharacterized protein YyaL (SSP411 family)